MSKLSPFRVSAPEKISPVPSLKKKGDLIVRLAEAGDWHPAFADDVLDVDKKPAGHTIDLEHWPPLGLLTTLSTRIAGAS